MTQHNLFAECPLCNQGTVSRAEAKASYHCNRCGLALTERSLLGLFKKGRFAVTHFGPGDYALAQAGLARASLAPDLLKITLGNVYPDDHIGQIAAGKLELIRPVRTILAEIILEQLNEACYIQVTGLRRGLGPPLAERANYQPDGPAPRAGMDWQDEGNLFCTTHRLVFPSDRFTFIRLDRKLVAVQAFNNGLAVQRKGEEFATYFTGCYPHEAALVAAFVIAKGPALQKMAAASGQPAT